VTTRLRIDLAYDGSGFSGWAKQPGRASVAGTLEQALCRVLRCDAGELQLVVAGRTDAGVHATGQVCHVDVGSSVLIPSGDRFDNLARRLNGALGKSGQVVVSRVSVAPPGFDARFSAISRTYSYLLADRDAIRDPRARTFVVWVEDRLDVEAMNALGSRLEGLHDFAAFCRAREGATTIRELQKFSWERQTNGVLAGAVVADAFCHSMVRSLVGSAVAVGAGRCTVDEVIAAREALVRTSLWKTMPAHGLTLVSVQYPEDSDLEARQRQTRGVRSLDSN
jgi:tRNA pseudouridine38-40 synthase